MNGFSYRLRQWGAKLGCALRRFMQGRYGTDKLNMFLLGLGLALSVLAMLLSFPALDLLLTVAAYTLMGIVIFRTLSRNTYKRYRENLRYLQLVQQLRDRQHRYYNCPRCRQQVRVPRGKGKIAISCPKCKEKFIRKT
jgi:hypothetical protein